MNTSSANLGIVQIPVNFLDQQWNNTIFQDLIKKRNDVFIYVRSIFLQGILVNDIIKWPKLTNGQKKTFIYEGIIPIIFTFIGGNIPSG